MLRILGSQKRLCNGLNRRDMLRVGGFGVAGLGIADLLKLQSHASPSGLPGFGKAKSCILLFLYGSPSQLETFDTKPDAPVEIRGDFGTISSSIPGYRVGELLPYTAKIVDRCTIARSLTHPYPIHGVAYATTGIPTMDVAMELSPHDGRHWPYIGSVIDFLEQQQSPSGNAEIPRNLAMPWPLSTRRTGEVHRAGPYAAFLGPAYHPVWTQFEGKGTKPMVKTLREDTIEFYDPYIGIDPNCRFPLSAAGTLDAGMTIDRLDRRRSLLDQFDVARSEFERSARGESFDRFQSMAFSLLTSDRLRDALDISRESMHVREGYGMSLWGQSCLAARRLVEAGGRLISVFWDEYGLAGSGWDTHWDHYNRMKIELAPSFDRGFSGLITDLDQRGMLEDTLVICISEHGRTPKINAAKGGGRDHWSRAYSAIFAGGGMARSRIVGKTDRIAGDVIDTPISPKDVLATVYHLMGIDPHTMIYDRLGRPLPIAGEGVVRPELLG